MLSTIAQLILSPGWSWNSGSSRHLAISRRSWPRPIEDGRCMRTITPNNEDTVAGKRIYIDLIEQARLRARGLVPEKLHNPGPRFSFL
jgi:hypothetical protein